MQCDCGHDTGCSAVSQQPASCDGPAAEHRHFAVHTAVAEADMLHYSECRHPAHQSRAARHPVLAQTREYVGHRHLLLPPDAG